MYLLVIKYNLEVFNTPPPRISKKGFQKVLYVCYHAICFDLLATKPCAKCQQILSGYTLFDKDVFYEILKHLSVSRAGFTGKD